MEILQKSHFRIQLQICYIGLEAQSKEVKEGACGKAMLDEIQHAEEQFVERIADNMNTFGVSSTLGRVLGTIYINRTTHDTR